VQLADERNGNRFEGPGTRRSVMLKTNVNHMIDQLRSVYMIYLF
jgi:hypothetical protein